MKHPEQHQTLSAIDGHIISARRKMLGDESQGFPHEVINIPQGRVVFNEQGCIQYVGESKHYQGPSPATVMDHRGKLIMPGFVDSHIHYPQQNMVAAYSGQLLTWLEEHTFPNEAEYALLSLQSLQKRSQIFIDRMLGQGTTTASIYSSSNLKVTEVLINELNRKKMRAIVGKVSMNRNAPEDLLISSEQDLIDSRDLLEKVRQLSGNRIHYALTPRFAPSCSNDLMSGLAELHQEYPESYVQTHFAENLDEIAWVEDLFPESKDYLDVYDQFSLLGERTILAHAIHTKPREMEVITSKSVAISHCPTSNLFLGSGLFPLRSMIRSGVRLSLGSDVGAGTSFSIWDTMADAYKISKVRGESVAPSKLFYLATLGAAESLSLDDTIGSIAEGKQADLQVIDVAQKKDLLDRLNSINNTEELLLALMYFVDDRCIKAVMVDGQVLMSR